MLYSLAMSVYIDGKSWNGPIPYVFAVDVANREWAETWIEHFNRRGAKEIFIPREKASAGLAAVRSTAPATTAAAASGWSSSSC